jgi:hypothetical protein
MESCYSFAVWLKLSSETPSEEQEPLRPRPFLISPMSPIRPIGEQRPRPPSATTIDYAKRQTPNAKRPAATTALLLFSKSASAGQ